MKTKEEVNPNPKPMFYACALEGLRKIALKCGYALAIHGTCASDMDLIAVRWSENYESPTYLVEQFCKELSRFSFGDEDSKIDIVDITKPELRFGSHIHYTVPIVGDWFVDLCVIQ
jgi:hypothetical protein